MRRLAIAAALSVIGACSRPSVMVVPVPLEGPEAGAVAAIPASADSVPLAVAFPPAPFSLSPIDALAVRRLAVPVAGARREDIRDSFDAPRDDGARRHHAIDIMAPRSTPVLSADDGRVLRLSTNALGGITLYAADETGQFVYYYAHLDRYHDAMAPDRPLTKGDTIGFVGTTGNAPKDLPHLHFQIMLMPADGRYWAGEPVNPYPLLRGERRDD